VNLLYGKLVSTLKIKSGTSRMMWKSAIIIGLGKKFFYKLSIDEDLVDFWHDVISITYRWRYHFMKHFKIDLNNIGALNQIWKWVKMSQEHFLHILFFYYKKEGNAVQIKEKICHVYGEDTLTRQIVSNWFRRFWNRNFDVKDALYSGRPIVENVDEILQKIEENCHVSSYDITKVLNIDQNRFRAFG